MLGARWNVSSGLIGPRCGREHFDARAGIDWDCGPSPYDTTWSIPDIPWNRINPGSRLVFQSGAWVVTDFGLEILSDVRERYEKYKISGGDLLLRRGGVYDLPIQVACESWVSIKMFSDFEEAYKVALELHCRKAPPPERPKTLLEWVIWDMNGRPEPRRERQPCLADEITLETTLRRARAVVRQRLNRCRFAAGRAA